MHVQNVSTDKTILLLLFFFFLFQSEKIWEFYLSSHII